MFPFAAAWSYSKERFFTSSAYIPIRAGEAVELVLNASGYDASFAPVTLAVADAVITVDGIVTEVKTDAEGKASITFDAAGTYVVSATSESMTLVAPVCIVTVAE